MDELQRYRGSLLGLAACDALGAPVEFKPPGSFQPVTEMVAGGTFDLPAGYWTDNTSMALCLAESLISSEGFDARDQMQRFVRWLREGHLSSTGACFDIGNTTHKALTQFERTNEPYSGPTDQWTAGNGSLMRLAPVPLFFARIPELAIAMCGESSGTTHGARAAVDACMYYGSLIVGAVQGSTKETLLSESFLEGTSIRTPSPLTAEVLEVASGSFKKREPPEIAGTG